MAATMSAVDAAKSADITYRMLDYWIRNGVVYRIAAAWGLPTEGLLPLGSGSRRHVPRELVPALRLIGRLQRELCHRSPGITAETMVQLGLRYKRGSMMFDGFTLSWRVEEE